jgi:hypothetical protein
MTSSNGVDNYLTSTRNFSVKFKDRKEHFKLAIDKQNCKSPTNPTNPPRIHVA